MMKEYLEKYGISKPENFEFSKRNLIIGKNGSIWENPPVKGCPGLLS